MQLKYLFTLLFLVSTLAHAQYDNVWVFGANIGLDFNGGSSPNAIYPIYPGSYNSELIFASGTITTWSGAEEANASVCDENGDPLFYTSGTQIYDRNGKIMPNGDSLISIYYIDTNYLETGINIYPGVASCAQGTMIVPFPNSKKKYYVFSLTSSTLGKHAGSGFLYYHVVDMNLNGGNGDVESGKKGIFVDSGFTEQMTSVAGDDCNIWVVLSTLYPTKPGMEFKSFEISGAGINAKPVVSNTGVSPGAFWRGSFMCFSPNRRKLIATRDNIVSGSAELYDFDPLTGLISNQLLLFPNSNISCYGACFSPNSEKVYVSKFLFGNGLYQFDLSSKDSSSILGSEIKLTSNVSSTLAALKLGPDGKVYYHSDIISNDGKFIGAVHFPDLSGLASQPNDTSVFIKYRWKTGDTVNGEIMLKPDNQWNWVSTFTNVISTIIRRDTLYTLMDTSICSSKSMVIESPLADEYEAKYLWEDGSTDRNHSVVSTGTYWVKSSNYCRSRIDTFKVILVDDLNPVITVDGFELSTSRPYSRYQWLLNDRMIPGATDSNYKVLENGDYRVVVTEERGCIDTSDIYKVTNVSIRDAAYWDRFITIYPNPAQDIIHILSPQKCHVHILSVEGKLLKAAFKTDYITIADLPAGIYMLQIADEQNRLLKVEKFIKMK